MRKQSRRKWTCRTNVRPTDVNQRCFLSYLMRFSLFLADPVHGWPIHEKQIKKCASEGFWCKYILLQGGVACKRGKDDTHRRLLISIRMCITFTTNTGAYSGGHPASGFLVAYPSKSMPSRVTMSLSGVRVSMSVCCVVHGGNICVTVCSSPYVFTSARLLRTQRTTQSRIQG